jgi:protein-histidine pros-kinase
MQCHRRAEEAPAGIVKAYGGINGFGWKPNETVAAQIVSVPMAVPIQIARDAFRKLVLYLGIGCLASLIAIDAAVLLLVIRPVRRLSEMADRISMGDMTLVELPVRGSDEIADLTASFNRMFVSLQKAFRLLNE